MSNAIPKTCPHNTVTKIAMGVTNIDVQVMQGGKKYFKIYKNAGDTAPLPPENLDQPRIPITGEWLEMPNYITSFRFDTATDVYIYCTGNDPNLNGLLEIGQFTGYDYSKIGISESFELAVSKGLIPGHSIIDKYGENADIDTLTVPEDITELGGEYPYDADGTAPIVSLVSDNVLDTQEIEILGQDINRNEITQTITLTGNVRAALTTPLWRVYRMSNEGLTGDNINGTVYCYTGVGNVPIANEIRAIIENGNNQTLMAVYTIPLGKVGYLYRGELGVSRNKDGDARCSYYSRRLGKVFKVKKRVSTVTNGSSTYQDERSFPDVIPSGTDIKLTVETASKNDMGIFGTFDILLVDESLSKNSYLQAIKQPGY